MWLPNWLKGFIEGVIAIQGAQRLGASVIFTGAVAVDGVVVASIFVALAAKTPPAAVGYRACWNGWAALAREGWQARMLPGASWLLCCCL